MLTVTLVIPIPVHERDTDPRVEDILERAVRGYHRIARRLEEIRHARSRADGEVDGDAEGLLDPALVVEGRDAAEGRELAGQREREVELRSLRHVSTV